MLLMLVLCQKPRKCTVKRFGINPNTSTILSRKCENNFLIHFLLACRSKLSFFLLFYQIYLLMPGCYYFLLKFSSLLFCLLSFFFFLLYITTEDDKEVEQVSLGCCWLGIFTERLLQLVK